MQQLIAWLDANKTWLFSGVGVALLLWLLKQFFGRKVASGPTLSQSGGAQSVYVQDIEKSYVTVQTGITVADAKQIAVDVVRGELSALTSEAHDTFARRTHEFADLLIERIVATGAGSLSAFKQPDMQLTIRQAQMQYGKTGDDDLRDTLLNIIEKVASNNTRDILKLVLQESIAILPKLTSEQINVLAVVFYSNILRNLLQIPVLFFQTLIN